MPTSRPRHSITETDEVSRALDDASHRWPEDGAARSKLLLRLLREGHRAITDDRKAQVQRRRDRVERTSGALTGAYARGYLSDLRADWPE